MNQVKSLVESKQFWVAVAQALAGVYAIFAIQYPMIAGIGYIAVLKSFLDIYLRANSTAQITSVLPQ